MRKKTIVHLLIITAIALAAAAAGYIQFNKPAPNVADSKGDKIAATDLYDLYVKDTSGAKKRFSHKVVEVSGMIGGASFNQQHQSVILLKTGTKGGWVNCTMEGPAKNVKAGNRVSIKGICNGIGEGEATLGLLADVYLVRCYLVR